MAQIYRMRVSAENCVAGVIHSNFRNIFTSPNTRVFGLVFGENCITVGLFFGKYTTML